MIDSVVGECGNERFGDVFLPDDFGEGLGAVTAVECCAHG